MSSIEPLEGDTCSDAFLINGRDQVIGSTFPNRLCATSEHPAINHLVPKVNNPSCRSMSMRTGSDRAVH